MPKSKLDVPVLDELRAADVRKEAAEIEQIRYTQRICKDKTRIEDFLKQERIGIVGMKGEGYPYNVPVNYLWKDGKIYFHGLSSGKKNEYLENENRVSFLVYKEFGTIKDDMPCHADTSYMSVMLFGTVRKLTDFEFCATILQEIVEKFMPKYYKGKISAGLVEKYRSVFDQKAVSVYELCPDEITAKENVAETGDLF